MNLLEQPKIIQHEHLKNIINILTAKELNEKKIIKPKWIIDRLFQSDTMNMLSAAPNNYKSWLTLDIAISIATGSPLFGFFEVSEPLKVWIINEEDIEAEIKDRMNTLTNKWPETSIYFSIQNQLKLDNDTVDQIISIAKGKGIGFIILDSLRSVHEAEENSATEMQKIMDQIKKITNSGIAVLFTHHNRKKGMFRNNNSDSEDSRGSTAINAAVHGHLSLEPKKEDGQEYLIIRQAKLKGAKKMEPFRLLINLKGEGHPFIYEGEYNQNSHSKIVEKIIKLMEDQGGKGINIKGFISADIIGEHTLRKVLKEMEEVKSITSKTWDKVQTEGLSVISDGTTHNEKFFFLPLPLLPEFKMVL